MAFDPNKPYNLVSGGFDPNQSFTFVEDPISGFDLSKPYNISDDEGPGAIDYAAAFGSDIAISEAGRLGGAAGSIARQRILNPDDELSYGQIVADAFINLIPGAKGAKFGASAVARQAAAGAGISAGARVAETAIDEGELPTLEE